MCSEASNEGWDFTPVINLINSLTTSVDHASHTDLEPRKEPNPTSVPVVLAQDNDTYLGLGNFDNLWRYLGQPLTKDSSSRENPEESHLVKEPARSLNKVVRWRDEIDGIGLAESDENTINIATLSKSQRRKERRRKRQNESPQAAADVKTLPSSSENESDLNLQSVRRSKDRKAIIDDILFGTSPQIRKSNQLVTKHSKRPQSLSDQETWPIAKPRFLSGTLAALFSPEQTAHATAAEKKAKLIKKLNSKFVDERQFLDISNISARVSNSDPFKEAGIHIFVDASNILIGFHNALMISRGLSIKSRIRRQPLSFHNLSIILERGRPTAKRVLAGSDNFPTIQEAKKIGYETNILQRVHKAKELTPRQKKFSNINSSNENTGQSSGSETGAEIYAPERWVEQAVDEILHLKILESIVDAKVPSTIVLATGDAAEAEYSPGFLKMVERALEKGWMVELVSFRRNTSGAYRRKDFTNKWGKKFKIVELDEFVEELHGV